MFARCPDDIIFLFLVLISSPSFSWSTDCPPLSYFFTILTRFLPTTLTATKLLKVTNSSLRGKLPFPTKLLKICRRPNGLDISLALTLDLGYRMAWEADEF